MVIWERGTTFPADMLDGFKQKLSTPISNGKTPAVIMGVAQKEKNDCKHLSDVFFYCRSWINDTNSVPATRLHSAKSSEWEYGTRWGSCSRHLTDTKNIGRYGEGKYYSDWNALPG